MVFSGSRFDFGKFRCSALFSLSASGRTPFPHTLGPGNGGCSQRDGDRLSVGIIWGRNISACTRDDELSGNYISVVGRGIQRRQCASLDEPRIRCIARNWRARAFASPRVLSVSRESSLLPAKLIINVDSICSSTTRPFRRRRFVAEHRILCSLDCPTAQFRISDLISSCPRRSRATATVRTIAITIIMYKTCRNYHVPWKRKPAVRVYMHIIFSAGVAGTLRSFPQPSD